MPVRDLGHAVQPVMGRGGGGSASPDQRSRAPRAASYAHAPDRHLSCYVLVSFLHYLCRSYSCLARFWRFLLGGGL